MYGGANIVNIRTKEVDIAKNIKIIEWLKTELLDSVAILFKSLLKPGKDLSTDALASIVIIAYLLGRRVGISFKTIDSKIKEKLNLSINDAHEVEQMYGDLSELRNYLEQKKR